jgi:Domain of unknown function (DUF4062)
VTVAGWRRVEHLAEAPQGPPLLAEGLDACWGCWPAISALRLTPVMFELGARPYPPREVYQQYLAQSDVFIGLYWQRYGQPAPGDKAPAPDRESGLADLLARIEHEAFGFLPSFPHSRRAGPAGPR